MSFVCGGHNPTAEYWPNPEKWSGELYCCWGVINSGDYRDCSCWEPIYDLEQQPVTIAEAGCRTVPCHDCAYRVDSPERQGDESVVGDDYELQRIVALGQPFWCHQGIRRPVAFVHYPTGIVVPGDAADYRPPMRQSRPYKADGTPADMCAGWASRRLRYLYEEARRGA